MNGAEATPTTELRRGPRTAVRPAHGPRRNDGRAPNTVDTTETQTLLKRIEAHEPPGLGRGPRARRAQDLALATSVRRPDCGVQTGLDNGAPVT